MKTMYYIVMDNAADSFASVPDEKIIKKFKNKNDAIAYFADPKMSLDGSYRLIYRDSNGETHEYNERRCEWT